MKVYLISRPLVNWKGLGKFLVDEKSNWEYYGEGGLEPIHPDSEFLVELCGRLCYMSYGKGRRNTIEYLKNLLDRKHFSVFEHANWTFFFTGISRTCTHELVRHRHFSYSQLSQRYVDHTAYEVHLPLEIEENIELTGLWMEAIARMKDAYHYTLNYFRNQNAVSLKKKELHTIARAILPGAIETKIAVTGNARAWREFIEKRAIPDADPEIRELATLVRDQLIQEAPLLFKDLKEEKNVPVAKVL